MLTTSTSYDYETGGIDYANVRRTDPHIASQIRSALGNAVTVLNVGAGSGSYEPEDRYVIAVEPSATMRAQRTRPAVNADASSLPFDDNSFDASMAILTIHHWPDLELGLREMRRVTRGAVVLMTFDPDRVGDYWLDDYCPEMAEGDRRRFPSLARLEQALGTLAVFPVEIPLNCLDGFQEAFYGRPEMLLRSEIRQAQSGWSFVPKEAEARFVEKLSKDLRTGQWDRKYGHLRSTPVYKSALRLIIIQ